MHILYLYFWLVNCVACCTEVACNLRLVFGEADSVIGLQVLVLLRNAATISRRVMRLCCMVMVLEGEKLTSFS